MIWATVSPICFKDLKKSSWFSDQDSYEHSVKVESAACSPEANIPISWWLQIGVLTGSAGQLPTTWQSLFTFRQVWSRSSVQFSHSVMSDSLQPHGLQHARLPCPSPTLGAGRNLCPSSHHKSFCHSVLSSPSGGSKVLFSIPHLTPALSVCIYFPGLTWVNVCYVPETNVSAISAS